MQNSKSQNISLLNHPTFVLLIFTLIGFILRIKIGKDVSFWTDEGQYIFAISMKHIFQLHDYIVSNSSCDQPALMYLLVFVWKNLFGISPASLKFLPLLATTLSIFASGYLCLKVTQNKFISYFLALFIALCPLSIRYSYDVTPYAILSLFGPISFFLFLDLIKRSNFLPSLSLIFVNIIFLNLHYYAFFAVSAQMLIFFYLIIQNQRRLLIKNHIAISFVYFFSAFFPMLCLFNPYSAYVFQDWIAIVGQGLHEVTFGGLGFYKWTQYTVETICVSSIVWLFFIRYRSDYKKNPQLMISVAYYAVTLVIIEIVQLFTWKFLGHYRYMLILFPLIFFVTLIAINEIQIKKIKYGIAVLLCALFLTDTVKTQPSMDQDFEGAFAYLKEQEKQKPFVIFFLPPGVNKPMSYYYASYYQLRAQIILDNSVVIKGSEEEMNQMVDSFRKGGIEDVYFIHYFVGGRIDFRDYLLKRFDPYFMVTQEKEFKDVHVYKMNLKSPDKTKSN